MISEAYLLGFFASVLPITSSPACLEIARADRVVVSIELEAIARTACADTLAAIAVRTRTAHAIATVANDPNEPAHFGSKERDAMVLASLATFEGGFVPWVDDGSCNDPAWRSRHALELRAGDCDGGHAFGEWQIHTDNGVALVGDRYVDNRWSPPGSIRIVGADIIADPVLGARLALHILRTIGITGYTGESGRASHPLADNRLNRAKRYLAAHPIP